MSNIIIGAVAGAISGFIVVRIMASKLIKRLDAMEIRHRDELLEIAKKFTCK